MCQIPLLFYKLREVISYWQKGLSNFLVAEPEAEKPNSFPSVQLLKVLITDWTLQLF